MNTRRKIFLVSSIALLSVGAIAVATGAAIAGFSSVDRVPQRIGSAGIFNETIKTVFLNPNEILGDGHAWTYNEALFYAYAFTRTNSGDTNGTWLSGQFGRYVWLDNMAVFTINTNVFTHIIFARINPNHASIPSWDAVWNQTPDIRLSNDYNYYMPANWSSAVNGRSGYKKNHVDSNNNWGSLSGVINDNDA